MKLILYSGGQTNANNAIHRRLVDLAGPSKKLKATYIPFCYDGSQLYFRRFVKRYSKYGIKQFDCLPLDNQPSAKEISLAMKSDVIYLAGGNTFYFLKHLRKSGLLPKLKKFAQKGGVLAGLSAGAIMLTPNIELAGFPPYDPDENEVGLKNLRALNLVNFEFFPHFCSSRRMIEAMMMYSLVSKRPIFACRDGSGVVVNGAKKEFFGEVNIFHRGHRIRIP